MPARTLLLAVALLATFLAGCAGRKPPQPDYDPWEGFNRKIFWFNDKLDIYALEPIARGWNYVMPQPVQRGFTNFFNNILFPVVFVNDLLQGKPRAAAEALARFEINLFFGGLGFYDMADHFGLPLQVEDTAQTLGVWGISPGPYLVLPFLGPSSPRDAVGYAGDIALGFYLYFVPVPYATIGATAIDIVNRRADYLDEVENAKEASLDYYTFVRNAYVQRRWKLINDAVSGDTSIYDEDELYNDELFDADTEDTDTENTETP